MKEFDKDPMQKHIAQIKTNLQIENRNIADDLAKALKALKTLAQAHKDLDPQGYETEPYLKALQILNKYPNLK